MNEIDVISLAFVDVGNILLSHYNSCIHLEDFSNNGKLAILTIYLNYLITSRSALPTIDVCNESHDIKSNTICETLETVISFQTASALEFTATIGLKRNRY